MTTWPIGADHLDRIVSLGVFIPSDLVLLLHLPNQEVVPHLVDFALVDVAFVLVLDLLHEAASLELHLGGIEADGTTGGFEAGLAKEAAGGCCC